MIEFEVIGLLIIGVDEDEENIVVVVVLGTNMPGTSPLLCNSADKVVFDNDYDSTEEEAKDVVLLVVGGVATAGETIAGTIVSIIVDTPSLFVDVGNGDDASV